MTERKITKSDCKYYRESDGNCLNFTYVGEYDSCTDGDLEHCYEKFPHFFNKDERMTEKRFVYYEHKGADYILDTPNKSLDFIEMLGDCLEAEEIVDLLNCLNDENEQLKKELKRCRDWLNSDKNDYQLTLAFIKNKGYFLKDIVR